MKGSSDKGLRGPPFTSPTDLQIPSTQAAHAQVNNSNHLSRHDARNAVYTFSARVRSNGGASNPISSHHSRWSRAPPRERVPSDDYRHWIYKTNTPPPSADTFVLVSYNILGVDNVNQHWRELYWHIPSFIMEWSYRKRKILLELGLWAPDIICMQEVDRFEDLQNVLVQQGYEGVYKGRTGGSSDGCAIFWRKEKFDLLQEESIEYQELDLRHNVAQLCVLKSKHGCSRKGKGKKSKELVGGNCVVVCNIHVLFNPNRGEIKLGQVRHLLDKAHVLSQEWGGIPVVLAGDFNSIPHSPLYQFLRNATLDVSSFDRRGISGQVEESQGVGVRVDRWTSMTRLQEGTSATLSAEYCSSITQGRFSRCKWMPEELKAATGSPTESLMRHSFNLQSAYSSIQGSDLTRGVDNEPLVTTFHGKFMGTVDYIWFTEGLTPVRVLDVLPVHILQKTRGLPSKKWGSDHLALACEFAFCSRGDANGGARAGEEDNSGGSS